MFKGYTVAAVGDKTINLGINSNARLISCVHLNMRPMPNNILKLYLNPLTMLFFLSASQKKP